MKKKAKTPKERNPFVPHLVNRKQGAHQKTKKALRREQKVSFRKEIFG